MIIPLSVIRFLQLVTAIVVLALSITAIKWQQIGSAPAASGYAAFAGAWGILTALVGIAAIFVASLSGIIMAGADLLAFVILLAGGITYVVKLRGISCGAYYDFNDYANPAYYDITNGGSYWEGDNLHIGFEPDGPSLLQGRCTTARADTVFLFLACVNSLAAAILVLLAHRRGGTRHSAV